jgi:hypothetical protein
MNALPQTSGWQAGFLQVLPAVQTHAQIQFRRLPLVHREEAIQEAIAFACINYQLLAAQGKLHVAHPGTMATFAVNRVRCGRHVGGKQDTANDLLSPRCQRRHGVRAQSIGGDWRRMLIADCKASIPDVAASESTSPAGYRSWPNGIAGSSALSLPASTDVPSLIASGCLPGGSRSCGGGTSGIG